MNKLPNAVLPAWTRKRHVLGPVASQGLCWSAPLGVPAVFKRSTPGVQRGQGRQAAGGEGSRATPACDLGQDTTGELRSASLARMCTVVPLGQSCEDRERNARGNPCAPSKCYKTTNDSDGFWSVVNSNSAPVPTGSLSSVQ